MSEVIEALAVKVAACGGERLQRVASLPGELTFEVAPSDLVAVCRVLRDAADLRFEMLVDLCGVDYLEYGRAEWKTLSATGSGFSRGVNRLASASQESEAPAGRRFAVVYHLLSITHNTRLRLRCWCAGTEPPLLDSVIDVWASANWFEREAFDLFGILFRGHPDLRRLLTDYGFIGHPFRKDFPLSGHVEVRFDPEKGRVVYQPVSIEPRIVVPKTIRHDNRYEAALKDVPPARPASG